MRRYFQVISNTVAFLAPSRLMQSRRGLPRRIHPISRVIRAFSQGRVWNIQQHDRQSNVKAPVAKISALGPFQTVGPVNGRDFLFPAGGVFPQPRFTLISRRAPDFQQRRIDPREHAFAGHRAVHIAQGAGRLIYQCIFARMAYGVQKPPCIWVSSSKKYRLCSSTESRPILFL